MENTIIQTTKGKIKGIIKNNVLIFKSIPYAKPPVGKLRFAPPQPMDKWNDVLDCTQFKNCPIQSESILINTKPSEDCLYLNIWTPVNHQDKQLPVFFWIHGGGFFNGCSTNEYYDGSHFVKNGVIVVTIEYRLGALGFLALKTLLDEYHTTGNWGTLDQIAALKWTHENIRAFGGNPNNITIAGESAGAFAVSNLVMSPLARGMFRRAIMESGCILSNKVAVPYTESKLNESMEMSQRFASIFGADDTKEGLEKLRQVDAYKLWETGYFSSDATEDCPFAFWPVLDGYALPLDPLNALQNGKYNKAEYIIGFNGNEGIVFASEKTNEEGVDKFIKKVFKENADKVYDYYKNSNLDKISMYIDIITYAYFKAGMTLFKDYLSRQNNHVYSYQFDYTPDGSYPMANLGPHHAVEILYVFATIKESKLKEGPNDKIIEEQMNKMWSNFMICGDPNKCLELPQKVDWYKYHENSPMTFYINTNMKCTTTKDRQKIKFFENLLYNIK